MSGFPDLNNEQDIMPLADLEAWAIKRALRICKGRVSEASRRLGIGRSTLYRKLDEYSIDLAGIKAG